MLWINLWQMLLTEKEPQILPTPWQGSYIIEYHRQLEFSVDSKLKSQSPLLCTVSATEFLPFLSTLTYFLPWKASAAIHWPIFCSEIQEFVYLPHSNPMSNVFVIEWKEKFVSGVYSSLPWALGYSYGLDGCFTYILTLSRLLASSRD